MRRTADVSTRMAQMREVACPACGSSARRSVGRVHELVLRDRTDTLFDLARCSDCTLVYVSTRVDGESPDTVYEGDWYGFSRNPQTDAFVDGRPYAERVLKPLENRIEGRRLLDVGCAAGEFLLAARDRGWDTLGVEVSPYAAAMARRAGLDVVTGTLADAHLPPASFDAVSLLDVIEHLEAPGAMLAEIFRLLRPGGVLVVETPNWASIYRKILRRWWAALQPRLHLCYFEAASLGALLHVAGFDTLSAETEIVALLSAVGRERGFGTSSIRGALRQAAVRVLLLADQGLLERIGLRIPSRPSEFAASFKARAEASTGTTQGSSREHFGRLRMVRMVNWPLDRLFLRLGMGEQLRVYARRP